MKGKSKIEFIHYNISQLNFVHNEYNIESVAVLKPIYYYDYEAFL